MRPAIVHLLSLSLGLAQVAVATGPAVDTGTAPSANVIAPAPTTAPAATAKPAPAATAAPWSVARRSIVEGKDANRYWQVDYLMRNDGAEATTIAPGGVSAEVEGWVSNSRVSSHATPRMSRVAVSGASGLVGAGDVIASSDECRRCRERAVLQVWPAALGDNPPDPVAKATVRLVSTAEQKAAQVAPGGLLRVRLRLEHEHFLYGPHEPLLGPRTLTLALGDALIRDTLPLLRETKLPRCAPRAWPSAAEPPADRLDTQVFRSAPSSLHLHALMPGEQSYRFNDCPVRYSTRMRLRFYYLIAPGTEGDCKARIIQSRDAPTAWKILSDGEIEQPLAVVGRWVKVERIFRTESEATSLSLEFRVCGDIGEMWVDDVTLEPVEDDAGGP